jgi:hypothetical protein
MPEKGTNEKGAGADKFTNISAPALFFFFSFLFFPTFLSGHLSCAFLAVLSFPLHRKVTVLHLTGAFDGKITIHLQLPTCASSALSFILHSGLKDLRQRTDTGSTEDDSYRDRGSALTHA